MLLGTRELGRLKNTTIQLTTPFVNAKQFTRVFKALPYQVGKNTTTPHSTVEFRVVVPAPADIVNHAHNMIFFQWQVEFQPVPEKIFYFVGQT